MDLPNKLESYVSFDAQSIFKSADLSQVLIIYPRNEGDSVSNFALEKYATQSSPYILKEGLTFTRPDPNEVQYQSGKNINSKYVEDTDEEFKGNSVNTEKGVNQTSITDEKTPPDNLDNFLHEEFFGNLHSDGNSGRDNSNELIPRNSRKIPQDKHLPRDVAISRLIAEQKMIDLLKGDEIVWCEEINIPTENLQVIVRGVQSNLDQVNSQDFNTSPSRSSISDAGGETHDEVSNSYYGIDDGMNYKSEIWKPTSDIIMVLNALGLLKDGVDRRRVS